MKQLVIAWLVIVALALALAGSCAIDHRSGAFECTKTADCDPPRVCSDGLCIQPAGTIDAPPGRDASIDASIDAPRCPDGCTSCNGDKMECTIDCGNGGHCDQPVTCPKNWNCIIKCSTPDSCRSGINCQNGASCDIACTGFRSCRNLSCPTGRCNVNCAGQQSCNTVACNQSCACDVKCAPGANCGGVSCSGPQCDTGLGCSSQLPFCNTCP